MFVVSLIKTVYIDQLDNSF